MSSRENKPVEATNHYRFSLQAILLSAVICLSPAWISSSYAQQAATATLRGIIKDPNGAVVPGSQVSATQKDTGIKKETTTDAEGLYVLSNLPPGFHEVRVQATGFSDKVSALPSDSRLGRFLPWTQLSK